MDVLETIGAVLGIVVVIVAAVLPALDERNRRKFAAREHVFGEDGKPKFATRDDMNGLAQRMDERLNRKRREIDRNAGLFVELDDRLGRMEGQLERIDERQTQQWQRISDQMASTARTIEQVTTKLETITREQQKFALEIARHRAGNSS